MPDILWFKDVGRDDVGIVGGKGANLGEMTQANFPVPPGFIVTSQAYFHYIESTGLKPKILKIIDSLNVDDTDSLEKKTAEVREMIIKTAMSEELKVEIIKAYKKLSEEKLAWLSTSEPSCVAVRSSATAEDLPEASFAGQQDTYLNVMGNEELINKVRKCWASLFTARATYYRKEQGFPTEKVGIAVVVQKMINSESSGVMFTADPTGERSKIIIEAGFGLGEAIVSGTITPDNYVVDRTSMKLIGKKINAQELKIIRQGNSTIKMPMEKTEAKQQKLADELIVELANIGANIENHYKAPQDIEWALEKGKLYIVQSRAITTLALTDKVKEYKGMEDQQGKLRALIKGLPASPAIGHGLVKVIPTANDIVKAQPGEVIVTIMTNPDWVPVMKKASAIITDAGGVTCHAAIVSRELGIPCVVGTANATKVLKDNTMVTVDGFSGNVYEGQVMEDKTSTADGESIKEEIEAESRALQKLADVLGQNMIKVKVNVALPDAAKKAADTGADGVGLLRAEHMITASGKHPAQFIREGNEEDLKNAVKEGIKVVLNAFNGKAVWYRSFDARTDEFRNLVGGDQEPHEDNPMLGWHGIRRDLDPEQVEIFKAQVKAIKELIDEGYKNIGLMLPFVVHVDELKKAKELIREIGLGQEKNLFEIGVMVETPAACWIIDDLINEGIDFISFGTNDLTQLTLGLDRNNEKIQYLFNEMHPAVLGEIKMVIEKCKKAKVKTSICGQAGSREDMVKMLIGFGIDSVSANIDAVSRIRKAVLAEEKKMLLERANK
ncbi:MAG: phosphoenolpyruvate synthase [archaeon]